MTEEQLKAITKHMTDLYSRIEEARDDYSNHAYCGWCLEKLYYQEDTCFHYCINCSDTLLIEQ